MLTFFIRFVNYTSNAVESVTDYTITCKDAGLFFYVCTVCKYKIM
jgi:hypothetical protein